MGEPMEGPFAEKLRRATAGREFPAVALNADVAAASLDLSGGGKSGRQKGRERHERREKREQHDEEGVSGRAVHTRGQFVETTPVAASPEQAEKEAKHEAIASLVEQINAADERLQALYQEYPEMAPTVIEAKADGSEAKVDVRTIANEAFAAAGRDAMDYEAADGSVDVDVLEKWVANLSGRLAEMEEAEDCFREAAKLPKIERIPQNREPREVLPRDNQEADGKRKNPEQSRLFEEKLASLEAKIEEWRGVRQKLLDLMGDRQYEAFIAESGPVGALARGKILKEVDVRITEYHQALSEGKKPGRREESWLERHIQGMDEIIAFGTLRRDELLKAQTAEPKEVREEGGPRGYASYSEKDLKATWARLPDVEMIETVEGQLEVWKGFDEKIKAFKSQDRVVDDLRTAVPKEKFDSTLSLTGRNENVAGILAGIRKRFEGNGTLDKKDAAILTALFFDYHRLLVAAEGVVQERERETPIVEAAKETQAKKEAEARAAKAAVPPIGKPAAFEKIAETDVTFEQELSKLTDLLGRWDALNAEFDATEFAAALARVRKKEIPPIKDLEGWLAKKTTPDSWGKQDRRYIEEEVLPEMERLIRQAEKAAKKIRESSLAPAEAVSSEPKEPVAKVIGLDGRVIERDESGELNRTEWQRMNPVEQNALRTVLFQRRTEYLTRANVLLKKAGVERAIDRQKLVRERFEAFMLKVIEREITKVRLTETDRQSIMQDLSKEMEAFFAQ